MGGNRLKLRRRVERLNTSLLLAGLGCVAGALLGAGLSIGEVSTKGVSTPGAIGLGVAGGLLIAASLFVGVDVSDLDDGAPGARGIASEQSRVADEKAHLRRAAAALKSALLEPDAMKRNVNRARTLVEATSADIDNPKLRRLANSLLDASHNNDLAAITLVLDQLNIPEK